MKRALVLLAIIAVGGVVVFRGRRPLDREPPRLTWIATAHQFGPVGYRDPAGAISPDGQWIAYSEGRFLRVRSVGGGPSVELPPGEAQIRNIAWSPDNRTILADGFQTQGGWALYDRVAGTRRGLWHDRESITAKLGDVATSTAKVAELGQPAWS
ncbi:MAG: PD40 domain-containing protein, partial [Acidobacteria bacterium]|nr:PD40 domain-containing protein [Acidobacteriota bacterium]